MRRRLLYKSYDYRSILVTTSQEILLGGDTYILGQSIEQYIMQANLWIDNNIILKSRYLNYTNGQVLTDAELYKILNP